MVELVAKEIVRNLLVVFLLVLVMFIAWDQSRAATVDLTLPPGDYMLVPVQPYTVVTIQSTPVDPPILDTDGDGVNDDLDQCPDTPAGDEVDETGCTVVPPQPPDPIEPPIEPDFPTAYSTKTLSQCVAEIGEAGGFCELGFHLFSVMREYSQLPIAEMDPDDTRISVEERGVAGVKAIPAAWNGGAWDGATIYLWGGGHNDGGIIDVTRFDFETGKAERVFTAPRFNVMHRDNLGRFAPRHDVSLPVASHSYDGILRDPDTGLIIVASHDQGFTFGYDATRDTTGWPIVDEFGTGFYAFNHTPETIKGIAPYQWKRLDSRAFTYPFLAYSNGNFFVGTRNDLWRAQWQGDDWVITDRVAGKIASTVGTATNINGEIWVRFKSTLQRFDADTFAFLGNVPGEGETELHGYTLESLDAENLIHWDGWRTVRVMNHATGQWQTCDFTDGYPPPDNTQQKVFSKWRKAPGYDDVFIGWTAEIEVGPIVYKHNPANCAPMPPLAGSVQDMLDAADVVTLDPAYRYNDAADLKGSKTLDAAWADVISSGGNGLIVSHGGPHVVKNLRTIRPGRSGVWVKAQDGVAPDLTLDGFEFRHQDFGVITSNEDAGMVRISNGTVTDSTSSEPGKEHNFYIGSIAYAEWRNVQSLGNDYLGHLLKSRAAVNLIADSVIDGQETHHSRVLDFPCGGQITIERSTLRQSPNADNKDLIAVAVETCRAPHSTLYLADTTWIGTRPDAVFLTTKEQVDIVCTGTNRFIGFPNPCEATQG